jgi:hypothetical protein
MPNKVHASVVHGADNGGNSVTGDLGIQNSSVVLNCFFLNHSLFCTQEEASSINTANSKCCIDKHGELLLM